MPSFQAEVDMIRSGIYNMEKVQTEPVYQVFVQLKMAGKMKEFNELYDKTWPAPAPEPAPYDNPVKCADCEKIVEYDECVHFLRDTYYCKKCGVDENGNVEEDVCKECYKRDCSCVEDDAGAQVSLVCAVFDKYETDPMYPLVVVNVGDDCEFFQLDETRAAIIQINSMMDYALDDEDFEGVEVSYQYGEKGGLDYQMTITGTTKLPVPDKLEKPDFFDSTPDDLVDYIKGLKGEMSVPDVD